MDELCYLDVNIWKQEKKEEAIAGRCDHTTEKTVDMDDDSKPSCTDNVENRYVIIFLHGHNLLKSTISWPKYKQIVYYLDIAQTT